MMLSDLIADLQETLETMGNVPVQVETQNWLDDGRICWPIIGTQPDSIECEGKIVEIVSIIVDDQPE